MMIYLRTRLDGGGAVDLLEERAVAEDTLELRGATDNFSPRWWR